LFVQLRGLWLTEGLRLEGGVSLDARDCTIWSSAPDRPAIEFAVGPHARPSEVVPGLSVKLKYCIVGAIAGPAAVSLDIEGSALAGPLDCPQAALSAGSSTFLASVRAGKLDRADDSIFLEGFSIPEERIGPVRHSYAATGGGAPGRQNCEPDLSVAAALGAARDHAALRARPIFVSKQFGDPGFAQLANETAKTIKQGAGNGFEMGCFNRTALPLREAALDEAVSRFAPWDMTLRKVFVT
jgi:hypothetical protein